MTHDEYEKARVALLAKSLYAAAVADATPEEAMDLARLLADALDRLVLEIDPFAPGTGKSDTLLKGGLGGPRAGGSR